MKRGERTRGVPVMRRLNRWAWAEILAALLLLVAVLASWWTTERRETEAEISYLLSVYGDQMESRLSGMDRTMGILLENGEDLALMGDDSESERQHAMIRMRKTLQATLRIDLSAEWGAIAHSAYGAEIQAGEAAPALAQKERIRDSARRAAAGASGLGAAWAEVSLNGEIFYRRETVRRNQAIHLYVRRETLMGPIRRQEQNGLNWSIVSDGTDSPAGGEASGDSAASEAGAAGAISDAAASAGAVSGGSPVETSSASEQNSSASSTQGSAAGPAGWFSLPRLERPLAGTPFRLVCVQDPSAAFGRLRTEIAVLVSMAALLLAFTLYLRRALRRSLIRPMARLEEDMRKIRAGDYEMRVTTESDAQEFRQMTGTLNQLLEEVLQLRIRELEKQLALQEANQKYIRLQLRPHFFLNAMATVSALSAKNKNQEIQTYIDALSRNIRYMFSAGMHTVPVREELTHVQNYLKMQELKYPDCVFSYVELPEELGDWPIPQMIIHTVVENEYKYAVSRDVMLMLLIRVSLEQREGQELLLIEIEDDGQGYPPEVIQRINTPGGAAEGDGTRVGLWSIKRMLELMYDRTGLLELANQSPHGAIARIRVPRETVHEVRLPENEDAPRLQESGKPAERG